MTKPKILLVEDDPQLLSLYSKVLAARTLEVVACASASDALQALANHSSFDLAVIDFWLGTTDASGLLDSLRDKSPETPVIVMSGGNQSTPIETAHAAAQVSGAISFLQKPFSHAALLSEVNRLLLR